MSGCGMSRRRAVPRCEFHLVGQVDSVVRVSRRMTRLLGWCDRCRRRVERVRLDGELVTPWRPVRG
jgi:hypothetical protein